MTNPFSAEGHALTGSGQTATANGPSTVQCVYNGSSSVIATFVSLTVSAGWSGGSGGSASDGYNDSHVPNLQRRYGYVESGTHWLAPYTVSPTSFTITVPQMTASAPPGSDIGGYCNDALISVTVNIYPVGMTYSGTQVVGGVQSIIVGQPFTATVTVPSGLANAGDTFTWGHPYLGDSAVPYKAYSASASAGSYMAFQTPPTTSSSLSCTFGVPPTSSCAATSVPETVVCVYNSATAGEGATITGSPLNVWYPGWADDAGSWVSNEVGKMTLVSNAGTPERDVTDPSKFMLFGATQTHFALSAWGIYIGKTLTDPPGFSNSGSGQFGYMQFVTSDGDNWTNSQGHHYNWLGDTGLDSGYPYPYVYWNSQGLWASSGSELLFQDAPDIFNGTSQNNSTPYQFPFNLVESMSLSLYLDYVPPGGATSSPVPVPMTMWQTEGNASGPTQGPPASYQDTGSQDLKTLPGPQFMQWSTQYTYTVQGGIGDAAGFDRRTDLRNRGSARQMHHTKRRKAKL